MRCEHCQSDNSAGANFCNHCGNPISVQQSVDNKKIHATKRQLLAAERRNITVLFCDLVGSTQLSESLDPEEWWDILLQYQSICADSVIPFEGYIAQYLGDGILVYFGYPDAHEDNARRAVLAGQNIIRSINDFKLQDQQGNNISLAVRIGIHSGLVVVGEIAAGNRFEFGAHGVTLNIAARIQTAADKNTLLISDASYRQIQDYFECECVGSRRLKGVSDPMTLYQVVNDNRLGNKGKSKSDKLPMVGRNRELNDLTGLWTLTCRGQGKSVAIKAEAGMGKSRLIGALIEDLSDRQNGIPLVIQCSPYHKNSAYFPVIHLLEQNLLQVPAGSGSEQKYQLISRFLHENGITRPETTPLLGYLLGMDREPADRFLKWSPELLKQKGLELLCEIFRQLSVKQPILLVFEDLHWVDPSTLELIRRLMSQAELQKYW